MEHALMQSSSAEEWGRLVLAPGSCFNAAGQEYPLSGTTISIGRESSCCIRINHNTVSRQHCTLSLLQHGRCELISTGQNGVWLNRDQVFSRVELKDDDRLTLGSPHANPPVLTFAFSHAGSIADSDSPPSKRPRLLDSVSWTCTICTLDNACALCTCCACGTPRQAAPTPVRVSPPALHAAQAPESANTCRQPPPADAAREEAAQKAARMAEEEARHKAVAQSAREAEQARHQK